ncbi:protein of unknown function [Xenorhabdus poinarii G6]|uniref:Uncharacterized protein n=1 Tax=Xenorhabdus poinarii G6 TaxID=1354304 RepID=A0A068R831_9GAMM|nr:hypothetical protein [Xenorhabdus poinarii]CDG22240.1 protein of unknown function [Xenorhabdus poinarii G6]
MPETFTCLLKQDIVELTDLTTSETSLVTYREFDALIPRRQRPKLSTATRLAGGLWQYYDLNNRLENLDANPRNTPLLILNRYANWDYVMEIMSSDMNVTLEGVNSYVATAWFPAGLQGYLTIEQDNKAEALTLATSNICIQAAAIDSLFQQNLQGRRAGAVVVGTFECIPKRIGTHRIIDGKSAAFGAFSLISSKDNEADISATLSIHKELYHHVSH